MVRSLSFYCAVVVLLCACSGIVPDKNVVQSTLGNGLRVVIVRNTIAPVVTVQMNYLAGSNESPPGFPGTAHALEHMMFRGSPGLSGDQINAILTGVGGESNAFTSQTDTRYISTVPAGDLEPMLRLEAIRMRGIDCDERQWGLERGALNQEVAMNNSSSWSPVVEQVYGRLFADTPFSHDALGDSDSYDRTAASLLRRFHRDWYLPNNAVLVIAGDVEPLAVLRLVQELFAGIPARPLPARGAVIFRPLKERKMTVEADVSYGTAMLAYRLPGAGHGDYAAGQVLAGVLGGVSSGFSPLEEREGFLLSGFEGIGAPQSPAAVAMVSLAAGRELRPAVTRLREIVAGYLRDGIPEDQVEAVKRMMALDAGSEAGSAPQLAEAWSSAVVQEGYQSPAARQQALQRVTVRDVTRVARAWLRDDAALAVLIPAGDNGSEMTGVKTARRGIESFRPRTFRQVDLPVWAEGVGRLPDAVPRSEAVSDMRLPNGLRLIVLRQESGGLLTLRGRVANEPRLQVPQGREGVDQLLGMMMKRPSTAAYSRERFQAELDRLGVDMELGTDFSMTARRECFEKGVEMLAGGLIRPLLPRSEFAAVQRRYSELLATRNSEREWEQAYLRSLYRSGDPELRRATVTTARRITLDDVTGYHAAVTRPDVTTIVIQGELSPENARRIVEQHFGSWQATGERPATDLPPAPDNLPRSLHVPDRASRQVRVTLAHTSRLTRRHPDFYPLLVGMRILSGSSASRLYRHVREERGLVYDIDAEFTAGRLRSVFAVNYGADAAGVEAVRRVVEADIADLREHPVSPAEIEQARGLAARQFILMGSSSDGLAALLLDLADEGLPLDQHVRAAREIRTVTPEQVRDAFRRWIRVKGLSRVTFGG